jgi:hypothetical protein
VSAALRAWTGDAHQWSLAALFAGGVGAAFASVLLAAQPEPSSLLWPLILVPALAVPLPVVSPHREVRVAAAIVMALWCSLTGLSIGLFFAPCLVLMIVAARGQDA